MLLTNKGQEVCRIGVVNENEEIIMDEYVLPENEVVDYVSHITNIN